jgi:hypothetical protein
MTLNNAILGYVAAEWSGGWTMMMDHLMIKFLVVVLVMKNLCSLAMRLQNESFLYALLAVSFC